MVGKLAHCGEAVCPVRTLLFDAVLCLHVELCGHLVSVVAVEVFVEQLVVAGNGAADAGGMGGKDGRYSGALVLQEQHTQARHPFVGLIDYFALFRDAGLYNDFDKASCCIAEHGCFVVVAVSVKGIYMEFFPSLRVNFVFLIKERLKIHQGADRISRHVPSSDAYLHVLCCCGCFPIRQQAVVFSKSVGFVAQIRSNKYKGSSELLLQCVCSRR